MKLNNRSCVLDAFAYVMGYTSIQLADMVGHQGPEGYHTQELIEVAFYGGYAITAFERFPQATNWDTGETRDIEFKEGTEKRFIKHLMGGSGVLLGSRGPKPHAVAWAERAEKDYYDPSTDTCHDLIQDGKIWSPWFRPEIFLRMDSYA